MFFNQLNHGSEIWTCLLSCIFLKTVKKFFHTKACLLVCAMKGTLVLLAFDTNPRTCAFKADIQCAVYQGFLMIHILLVFLPPKVLEYVSSNMSDFGR